MQPCTHMLEYAMVRGSGVATSRKIPLGQHSHMLSLATVKEKKKRINASVSDIYIFQTRNILKEKKKKQERKEARSQEPKKGGDHL